MRNPRTKFIVVITLFLFCFVWSQNGVSDEAIAVVKKAEGEIKVQSPGESEWTIGKVGRAILEGTKLSTGADSSAQIEFAPGHQIQVSENTQIEITEAKIPKRPSKRKNSN